MGQNISQICYGRKQSHVDCQSALLVRKPRLNHHYHTPPITLNSCNINYHGDVSLKSNILQLIHSCASLAHSIHCSTLNTHSLYIECVASHKEGNPLWSPCAPWHWHYALQMSNISRETTYVNPLLQILKCWHISACWNLHKHVSSNILNKYC